MHTHAHVEDYIEIIMGYRDPDGKGSFKNVPLIDLARYDVNILHSLAHQSFYQSRAYTDKQAELAVKLVLKYRRQLYNKGINVDTLEENPRFRNLVRTVDRRRRATVENDKIALRFPFNGNLVDEIRQYSHVSAGNVYFDRQSTAWLFELTESNVNWVCAFAEANQIDVEDPLRETMDQILEFEKTHRDYAIELDFADQQLTIRNAPESLIAYIEQRLGGFDLSNLLTLADNAPVLGYTIGDRVREHIRLEHGEKTLTLIENRRVLGNQSQLDTTINTVVKYLKTVRRFPAVIYDPSIDKWLYDRIKPHFADSEIILIKSLTTYTQEKSLLISNVGLVTGGRRTLWVQSTDKIIYITDGTFNEKGIAQI